MLSVLDSAMDHFPNSEELACLIGQWARDHPLEPLDQIKKQCFGLDIKDKVLIRMVKDGGYGYDRVWWEMTTEPLLQLVEYMGTTLEVLATAQDRNSDEVEEVEWEYTASIKIHANEEPLKCLSHSAWDPQSIGPARTHLQFAPTFGL
jgi:hypothetical protein